MAGTPRKRDRRIRELLEVLDDPKELWRPVHTSMLLSVVKAQGNGAWQAIDKDLAKEYNERKKELARLEKESRQDIFRQELEAQLPQVAEGLKILSQYGFAKAIDEAGNFDPKLIADRDAKVMLSAMEKMMKALGLQTLKVETSHSQGSAFDFVDGEAVEDS